MSNQRVKGSKGFLSVLTVVGLLAVGAPAAHAVPALQLDIAGGFYDTATQTIMTSNNTFTLYALLNPTAPGVSATGTYYLSVALEPVRSTAASLGSFSVNGTAVNATGGMTYGTPPLEGLLATFDSGDLAQHGMYPTYFKEYSFTFNSSNRSGVYNTQDTPGGIHAGTGLLYAAFQVDKSLLNSPYQLHFDLYSESLLTTRRQGVTLTDIDINKFAPFSHDAGTTTRGVPEPSVALLLGIGLVGFGVWQRRSGAQSV